MKSPLATAGLLLVLLAAIGVVVWGSQLAQRRAEAERTFTFPDTAGIVAITLVEKHADTTFRRVDVLRRAQGWTIADTLEAFVQPVQTLLQTLVLQTVRAPVAPSAVRNVLKFLKDHRVEVTLRWKGGREETFYVGGPTPDQRASYMLRPGSNQPYEVFIPGFEGYVTSRYYPDLSVWQPNTVFAAKAADLRAVQVDFYGEPGESWRLERSLPGGPWRLATEEPLDSAKAADYLLAYTGPFYADELANPDSLSGLEPLAEVRLLLWSEKAYHFTVYPHSSSSIHYYLKLHHSPYFSYVIGRYTLDRLLYRRREFLARPS